ncbi:hypothetical protein DER45DRAFT_636996 [Fusarium avenaceum]|nr:hypothetical protein DER45DRAFT_636996 [Fusarium avenaceum]
MQYLATPFTPNSRCTGGTLGQIHYAGQYLGQVDLGNGFPKLFRKGRYGIFSKTGQSILFEVPRDMPIANASNYSPGFPILPPRKTTLSILHAYLGSTFKLVFPFIDDLLFAYTITLAYSRPDGPATLEHLISKCCVLAFLSLTDLFRTAADEFPDVKTDACAHEARHILTSILEEPDITTLQSVLILQQHEAFAGRLSTAIVFHGLACRMVTVLGGHLDVPIARDKPAGGSLKECQRQHLRTLFWMCYVFDKETTLRTSHPPFLTGTYCDLTPPNNDITNSADNEAKTLKLFGDICISHLKGKASHLLYSIQAS